jgi:hypothetical protein
MPGIGAKLQPGAAHRGLGVLALYRFEIVETLEPDGRRLHDPDDSRGQLAGVVHHDDEQAACFVRSILAGEVVYRVAECLEKDHATITYEGSDFRGSGQRNVGSVVEVDVARTLTIHHPIGASMLSEREHFSAGSDPVMSTSQPTPSATVKPADATSRVELAHSSSVTPDLAPMIFRQRLAIENTYPAPIIEERISRYLRILSVACGMRVLAEPVTRRSKNYGWAGRVHWKSSGAHFCARDSPKLFSSAGTSTCRELDVKSACKFAQIFFEARELVAMVL